MGSSSDATATHYQTAMAEVHKRMKRPSLQRSMFSMARTTPTDMVRSKLSTTEIQQRALTYLPDEMLSNIPDSDNTFSLFQGFQASFPSSQTRARSTGAALPEVESFSKKAMHHLGARRSYHY